MHSAGDEQSRDLSEVVASCREVLPQPYCRYVPSPMAMGIPVSSQLLGSSPAAGPSDHCGCSHTPAETLTPCSFSQTPYLGACFSIPRHLPSFLMLTPAVCCWGWSLPAVLHRSQQRH